MMVYSNPYIKFRLRTDYRESDIGVEGENRKYLTYYLSYSYPNDYSQLM